jgi:hypothetical protein
VTAHGLAVFTLFPMGLTEDMVNCPMQLNHLSGGAELREAGDWKRMAKSKV